MKFVITAALAAPLLASSALAFEPEDKVEETPVETKQAEKKDERICKYVRTDQSSRRKTKICRTTEQWRELNNPS